MKWIIFAIALFIAIPAATADHKDVLHEGDAIRVYQWCETIADLEALVLTEDGADFLCWQPKVAVGGVLGPSIKIMTDRNMTVISIHEVTHVIVNIAPEGQIPFFEPYFETRVFIAVRREDKDA